MQYIKSSQLIETCTCESLSCNLYYKLRMFVLRKKNLPLRQGLKQHTKNWLVTSFSKMADTFAIVNPCNHPRSSKRNHLEYLSSGRTWAKEDTFLGLKRNDITKNYLYTSEITVSVDILVGPQPFFLKYKTFTTTVKRRYFAILTQPKYLTD